MLRYVVPAMLVLCLVSSGLLAYRWVELLQEEEAWELERIKGAQSAPARLLITPKERSAPTKTQPAPDKVVPSDVPAKSHGENNGVVPPEVAETRRETEKFLRAVLDESMRGVDAIDNEDEIHSIDAWSIYDAGSIQAPWMGHDHDGKSRRMRLPTAAQRALLAMEGLDILGINPLEIMETKYWREGGEPRKLLILAGLRRARGIANKERQRFLLGTAFSIREPERIRTVAVHNIRNCDLASDCVEELAEYVNTHTRDSVWDSVVHLLAERCGGQGQDVVKALWENALKESDASLEEHLADELGGWFFYEDHSRIAADLLDMLERKFQSGSCSDETLQIFQNLWDILSLRPEKSRKDFVDFTDKIVDLFEKAPDHEGRFRALETLGYLPPTSRGLELLFAVMENKDETKLHARAAEAMAFSYGRMIWESANQARLLRAYEREADTHVKNCLTRALASGGGPQSLSQLLAIYKKEAMPSVRASIVEGIKAWGTGDTFLDLQRLFELERDQEVRNSIIGAMVSADFDRGLMFMEMAASKERNEEWRKRAQELKERVR